MRILFLSTWYPHPPDNGSKLRVYYLLKALGERHHVKLLSLAFGTADSVQGGQKLQDIGVDVQTVACNPFERSRGAQRFRFFSPTPVVNRPLPAMRSLVQQALAERSYDAVIVSTKGMAAYINLVPSGTARILEEHNSLSRQMWERYQRELRPIQRLRCWASWQKTRRYEAGVLLRHHLAVMVSEEDRQATLSMLPGYSGPVEVVPNGVDCTHNRPGLATATPNTLIFNGALSYSANYDAMQWFLAEVYPLVKRQAPSVRLAITGSTEGVDLSSLQTDDSVTFTGFVDDVRFPVAQAAVCVVPIRQGGGTRLKILEAMALGTPVIATSKGAEGLQVMDEHHLLIADTPDAFAMQTARLMQDTSLQAQLRQNARQLVQQHYDWSQIGQAFVHLIEKTVYSQREASRHHSILIP